MEALMIALLLLAAVLAYVCCRASGNGDDMAEKCLRVISIDPETADTQYDADMLREAMEEEQW